MGCIEGLAVDEATTVSSAATTGTMLHPLLWFANLLLLPCTSIQAFSCVICFPCQCSHHTLSHHHCEQVLTRCSMGKEHVKLKAVHERW